MATNAVPKEVTMPANLDAILAHVDAHLDESVERLRTLVAIKSISTDPAYTGEVKKAAEWLAADLKAQLRLRRKILTTTCRSGKKARNEERHKEGGPTSRDGHLGDSTVVFPTCCSIESADSFQRIT